MVRLSGALGGFAGAVQFLTRIPVRLRRAARPVDTVPWFGVVGALIGAVVGGVAAGMWHLVPPLVVGAVAIAVGLLVTGAFHEDGLADVADAFGGGWDRTQRLQILKDPRHGTYGVAALCASVAIRIVCVGSLPGPAAMFASCVAAHALGRTAAVVLTGVGHPAQPDGLGALAAREMRPLRTAVGGIAGIALAAVVIGWWIAPLVGVAAVGTAAVAWLAYRKIGGIGGDVLGATEQIVECLCLVALTGLATHHALWWSH